MPVRVFSGAVVLESSDSRQCAKCHRMIGKRGKSYTYGSHNLQVCQRCHHRAWQRRERKPWLPPLSV
jgi:hypothetical protein